MIPSLIWSHKMIIIILENVMHSEFHLIEWFSFYCGEKKIWNFSRLKCHENRIYSLRRMHVYICRCRCSKDDFMMFEQTSFRHWQMRVSTSHLLLIFHQAQSSQWFYVMCVCSVLLFLHPSIHFQDIFIFEFVCNRCDANGFIAIGNAYIF